MLPTALRMRGLGTLGRGAGSLAAEPPGRGSSLSGPGAVQGAQTSVLQGAQTSVLQGAQTSVLRVRGAIAAVAVLATACWVVLGWVSAAGPAPLRRCCRLLPQLL